MEVENSKIRLGDHVEGNIPGHVPSHYPKMPLEVTFFQRFALTSC